MQPQTQTTKQILVNRLKTSYAYNFKIPGTELGPKMSIAYSTVQSSAIWTLGLVTTTTMTPGDVVTPMVKYRKIQH